MATIGQKRKLKDTDISMDGDTPTKQQKLMEDTTNDKSEENAKEDKKEKDENNEKDENEDENEEKDTISILREQIEFYFSDSNYSLDKYILNTIKEPENKGFFPITHLMRFNALQQISTDKDLIIKAIESSSKLEMNESKDGLKRDCSMGQPPTKEEIYSRTIFAKGFHPRIKMDQLKTFWQKQVDDPSKILSVRVIRDKFEVGISEKNEQKIVHRFLGNCSVELSSIELAEEFSKMTFNSPNCRLIRCGMYQKYFSDDIEWIIKRKYYPFQSQRILHIKDIPIYATYADIKNWIGNALYGSYRKKNNNNNKNKIEYVHKDITSSFSFVRFSENTDINQVIKLLKKKPLMGRDPKIIILNDEKAQKIWKKVAEQKYDINKDVEIKIKSKKTNPRKHKLENADSPQPIKKQKLN